jgi:hypothetical protein
LESALAGLYFEDFSVGALFSGDTTLGTTVANLGWDVVRGDPH